MRTIIAGLFILSAAVCQAGIRAHGLVDGKTVEAIVDSEIARYLLEEFPDGANSNPATDSLISSLLAQGGLILSDWTYLRQIASEYSLDFASLLLSRVIRAQPQNLEASRLFGRNLKRVRTSDNLRTLDWSPAAGSLVLFVPGWDYESSGGETGADFATPRQLLADAGIPVELVPIRENGEVDLNAQIVAEMIERHASTGRRIILVSASSGGPAAALALGRLLPEGLRSTVAAWVNIGGILRGSPVADHYLRELNPLFLQIGLLVNGWDREAIESMSVRSRRPVFDQLSFFPGMQVVNLVGIPLASTISERARGFFELLAPLGPNDGLTLILDELLPGSRTIVEFGRDHFFNDDPEIDLKTIALAMTVLELLHEAPPLSGRDLQ